MAQETRPLRVFFFPFPAHGHMIPTIDMAKLFSARGVHATIITTPLNAPLISASLAKSNSEIPIHIHTIDFPCAEAGLPRGCENIDSVPSPDLIPTFFQASTLLQQPFEQVLLEFHPDSVVADMFFPWATGSAAKFGIPRLVFHGTAFFPLCASQCLRLYKPYENVSTDSEPFVIPNLPGEITMTWSKVPDFEKLKEDNILSKTLIAAQESEMTSYGVVVNSFYELEKDYVNYYKNVLGRKAWHIGPVSICNMDIEEKGKRGKEACISQRECLKWLDDKEPNSVVYICFGSVANFPESQLREIAMGLEASGQQFIWVVRKNKKDDEEEEDREDWLPEGFEKRMEGKGLIIRGWAPQVLILEHGAIGAFVTHCGWNSTIEAVSCGVPMVTWPISAEQFYNENLVTEVLRIGIPVGVEKWMRVGGDSVKSDAIEKAVKRTIEGEEAKEMRDRATILSQKAKMAVEEGGSSYSNLNALIEKLGKRHH